MKHGLKAIKRKDPRTYDFKRTFGSLPATRDEFNFDKCGLFPDQDLEGMPNGCTAFTENDIATNDDTASYYDDQKYTYENTKLLSGLSGDVPVDHLDALKSGTVYGVKAKAATPDEALFNRRAPYFIIKKNPDYYDGLISAMLVKKGGISVGTPWLPEFENIGPDGIIPAFAPPTDFTVGHCWAAYGQKLINGEPRIICKSWQGKRYGDNGYCYFNREQINALLGVRGSGAFGQKHASPEDIETVKLSIWEAIVSYFKQWVEKLTKPKPGLAAPILVSDAVQIGSKTPTLLEAFCTAIKNREGKPGDRSYRNNNPGNCKFYRGGYAPIYGVVGEDRQGIKPGENGFAIFKDYPTGWLYLKNLVLSKARRNPEKTLVQFMQGYAPSTDGNDPIAYARFIASAIGVNINSFTMGKLLT